MAGRPPAVSTAVDRDRKTLTISFKECMSVPLEAVQDSINSLQLDGILPPKTVEIASIDNRICITFRRPPRIPSHWRNKRYNEWRSRMELIVKTTIIGIQSGVKKAGISDHVFASIGAAA